MDRNVARTKTTVETYNAAGKLLSRTVTTETERETDNTRYPIGFQLPEKAE